LRLRFVFFSDCHDGFFYRGAICLIQLLEFYLKFDVVCEGGAIRLKQIYPQ
jgi:hypothetical protein